GTTDHTGTYNILVADEHEHEICESVLIRSPVSRSKTALPGRERAQLFLSCNNDIASVHEIRKLTRLPEGLSPASLCPTSPTYEQSEF
ncbi:hypothetical protein BHE74_00018852, partial [Ensete ventricosum]